MSKKGYGTLKPEISVAVGIGVGVAAVAGLAAGGAIAAGMMAVSSSVSSRRNTKPPLQDEDIKYDSEGRIENWPHVLKIVQQGGVAPHLRAELWPVLLGVYPSNASSTERATELTKLRSLYTKLVLVCQELEKQVEAAKEAQEASLARRAMGDQAPSPEKPPLPGNLAAFAEAHRIIVMDAVRTDMRFQPSEIVKPRTNGYSMSNSRHNEPTAATAARVTVLPVSLGEGLPELMLVEPPAPPSSEAVANGELPVWRSKLATSTIDSATHIAPLVRKLMMRLVNILSAYAVHDPENGYCQGMSDLAAAFIQLIDDDALAFACFERMMRDVRQNFRHDEQGIKAQLARVARIVADTDPTLYKKLEALGAAPDCTFAYRMVIVMLRRELPLGETLVLWESKWATEAAASLELSNNSTPMVQSAITTPLDQSPAVSLLAQTVASMDIAAQDAVAEGLKEKHGAPKQTKSAKSSRHTTPKALFTGESSNPLRSNSSGSGKSLAPAAAPALPDMILQFVAAAIRSQRSRILNECQDSDDILRLFNSVKIDFWTALSQARKQHRCYAQGMAVLERL